MNNINQIIADINPKIVADSIYQWVKRESSDNGIELSSSITQELNLFLQQYSVFVWQRVDVYYRIDAYCNEDSFFILDINAAFVDGWGNALNFTRSVWQDVDRILLQNFPENMYLQEQQYRPEFQLCIDKLQLLGIQTQEVQEILQKDKIYVYGVMPKTENIYPFDGIRIDNKMNLALFAKQWK